MSSIGYRLKCQLNENSKMLSYNVTLPEMNHNDIVGWENKLIDKSFFSLVWIDITSDGELQGGPMYVIEQGMGKKFKFLSYWFSIAGLVGCLSLLQVNQLTQILSDQCI